MRLATFVKSRLILTISQSFKLMLFNREECSDKGGTSIGSCAEGYGVCCTCKFSKYESDD